MLIEDQQFNEMVANGKECRATAVTILTSLVIIKFTWSSEAKSHVNVKLFEMISAKSSMLVWWVQKTTCLCGEHNLIVYNLHSLLYLRSSHGPCLISHKTLRIGILQWDRWLFLSSAQFTPERIILKWLKTENQYVTRAGGTICSAKWICYLWLLNGQ